MENESKDEYVDPQELGQDEVPWRPAGPEPLSAQARELDPGPQPVTKESLEAAVARARQAEPTHPHRGKQPLRTPDEVRVALEKRKEKQKQKSWLRGLGLLVVSVAVFAALGLFRDTVKGVAIFVGVIFVHEMGHLVAMKIFGYRDVQMFFIPLFGAAVTGDESMPSGGKRAVVSLMGPVPGIFIGIVVAVVYFFTGIPLLLQLARVFLILNAFNLLPFHPLDGARFFEHVLFCRHPKAEVVFKFVASLALFVVAMALDAMFLAIFVGLLLFALPNDYRCATLARRLKRELPPPIDTSIHAIPQAHLERIVTGLNEKLPENARQFDRFVTYVELVWRRIAERPPKAGATTGLLICYGVFVLIGIVAPISLEVGRRFTDAVKTIERETVDGEVTMYERHRFDGILIREIPLNTNGMFHGLEVVWDPGTKKRTEDCQWENGRPHGTWRRYGFNGDLHRAVRYDDGKVQEVKRRKEGKMVPVPRDQWLLNGAVDILLPQVSTVWLREEMPKLHLPPGPDPVPVEGTTTNLH